MRVLVTGANGFVGGHLLELLSQRGDEVTAVSREDIDICDPDAVAELVAKTAPERIVHLAAQASVAESFREPLRTFEINVLGTVSLLEAVRTYAPDARVLVASSADTYGKVEPSELPVSEDALQRPVSPYAASKVAQEAVAFQIARAYGTYVVCTRSFNAIGPRQSTAFALPSFAAQIAASVVAGTHARIRVGNLEVERDFVDVRDVVRAQVMLLDGEAGGRAYNICSGVPVRLRDALDRLIVESGVEVSVEIDQALFRPADLPRMAGDNRRLCSTVPWSATFPLSLSLRDLYAASLARAAADACAE